MVIARANKASIIVTIIASLLTACACAAGIDDITGYQPSSAGKKNTVEPYSVNEIIKMLPRHLDEHGVYQGNWVDMSDPRAIALDEEKFGKCEDLYISRGRYSRGGGVFDDALSFVFPTNEEAKIQASNSLKYNLAYIENPNELLYSDKRCDKREQQVAQLKELLNAVIQAGPSILQEKQRLVDEEKGKHDKLKAKAREQARAQEKSESERQAIILAEKKGAEERAAKLSDCQNTNEYKLFDASVHIVMNQAIAVNAQNEIDRQKEGEKISGYVDKQVMYEMGNKIAGVKRINKDNFEIYKQLGGTARNVESVRTLDNPCKK
jgi:hypothetical protein